MQKGGNYSTVKKSGLQNVNWINPAQDRDQCKHGNELPNYTYKRSDFNN